MFTGLNYAEHIGDKRLEARVRRRYGRGIAALETEGFVLHTVYSESADSDTGFFVIALLIRLFMFKWEPIKIAFPNRVTFYKPLLFHEAEGCYATVSSFGVTISGYFIDGTVLVVTNSWASLLDKEPVKKVPEKSFFLYTIKGSVLETWKVFHLRLEALQSGGRILKLPLNFEDYMRIEYRHLEVYNFIKGERK